MLKQRLILQQLNKKCNSETNTFVEYIFTKPAWRKLFFNRSDSATNPYGHSAIRYCYEINGKKTDTVMNISGLKGEKLVNYFEPDEYIFADKLCNGNQQGGISNRSFISIRINNVDIRSIDKMHQYYESLNSKQENKEIEFSLFLFNVTNHFRPLFHKSLRGNCAYFTSIGLVESGLLMKPHSWPLLIFFKIMFKNYRDNRQNMNIIAYQGINYKFEPQGSLIYPFYSLRNRYSDFWNLDSFANIIVNNYIIYRQKNAFQRWKELYMKLKDKFMNFDKEISFIC